jgi:bis(5'-adenosyl)-triphosphatase
VTDLFQVVQRVQKLMARRYFQAGVPLEEGGSFNVAIQDGAEAGQTVAHVHVHVIPRPKKESSTPSDEVYVQMASEAGNIGGALWDRDQTKRPVPGGEFPKIEDSARRPRSMEEMVNEATELKDLLSEMEAERK